MRYIIGFAFAQLAMTAMYAQSPGHSFLPVDEGSTIRFKIKNFGFNSEGSFKGLQGTIHWDAQNVEADSFDVSVDANSVNTGNDARDEHLRKESYFDVEKYPRIRFVASSVAATDANGHYRITGKLTIKGTTKEIAFPFLATPAGDDFIFKGSFTINRRDFGVGGSSTLSNDVTVFLTVLARRLR
ncbi:MAG TPA: YceI family protein [Puia sp.]|nr:YceI family protein [Puia sp.]